jgi:hypothetical protein
MTSRVALRTASGLRQLLPSLFEPMAGVMADATEAMCRLSRPEKMEAYVPFVHE